MADQEEGVPAPNLPKPTKTATTTAATTTKPRSNWSTTSSTFKLVKFQSRFSGKPEDAEAHLLHSNDWMNAHHFIEGVKVQRFCFTLLGEARLWYHSLEPININWPELQNLFRQQYSKVGIIWNNYFTHGDPLILMRTQRP